MSDESTPVVKIRSLSVTYGGSAIALDGIDLDVAPGEVVALVGESGSGKTTLARALLGVLPRTARIRSGTIEFEGARVDDLDEVGWRRLRGARIGYVPQDPALSLNPTRRVGPQVAEAAVLHRLAPADRARRTAREELRLAGLPDPERTMRSWPHELSGGMRQRVLIAAAFSTAPSLLVADEPTSALDATVQRRVLDRLAAMVRESGTALVLITHDLAVAAERADRVVVLREGRVVEQGPALRVFTAPEHPYTQELVAAVPDPASSGSRRAPEGRPEPLLVVRGLEKRYRADATAVDGVDLAVMRGSTLAVVGESGSGKTSIARMVLGLTRPTAGAIEFDGVELTSASRSRVRSLRRRMQVVQQNPHSTFDPRVPIGRSIGEPLDVFRVGDRASRRARVLELLDQVALPASFGSRRPSELSGGQLQRAAIARAIALQPDLVVCDEPVSALDVSVQAQILRVLRDLQDELGVAYLFITHDLGVVAEIAHDVLVLSAGRVVETGPVRRVFVSPRSPTTRDLLAAAPDPTRPQSEPPTEGRS